MTGFKYIFPNWEPSTLVIDNSISITNNMFASYDCMTAAVLELFSGIRFMLTPLAIVCTGFSLMETPSSSIQRLDGPRYDITELYCV